MPVARRSRRRCGDLAELIGDEDTTKAGRVMAAVLKMKKLDLGALKEAHSG